MSYPTLLRNTVDLLTWLRFWFKIPWQSEICPFWQ